MTPAYVALQVAAQAVSFDQAQAATLRKPHLWPGAEGRPTAAQAVWSTAGLHVAFTLADGLDPARDDPANKRSLENDDRVEVFVQPSAREPRYVAYEMNRAGHVLDYAVRIEDGRARLDYAWHGTATVQVIGDNPRTVLLILIPWADLGLTGPPPRDDLRIGFYRGTPMRQPDGSTAFRWSCWVDPQKAAVNFHCLETFADLQLKRTATGNPGQEAGR